MNRKFHYFANLTPCQGLKQPLKISFEKRSAFVNTEKVFEVTFSIGLEKEPKIELVKRLRKIRYSLSFAERRQFAKYFDIPETTMHNYERNLQAPSPVSIMRIYENRCGISLDWLVIGEGEMFSDMAKAKEADLRAPTIPTGLMKKLDHIA